MLGCDIVDIERIERSVLKFGDKFIKKILTKSEIDLYTSKGSQVEFVAGRFAAKEAISKAVGSGFSSELWFTDISILPDKLGKPEVYIKGVKQDNVNVSISHSRLNAMAVSIVEGVKCHQ